MKRCKQGGSSLSGLPTPANPRCIVRYQVPTSSSPIRVVARSDLSLVGRRSLSVTTYAPLSRLALISRPHTKRCEIRNRPPVPALHAVSFATSGPSDQKDTPATEEKPKEGKIREFIRKYGPIGVVTYFGVYGLTLSGLYIAFDSDIIMTGDVLSLLHHLPLHEYFDIDPSTLSPKLGSLAKAWIVTKFTEPVRLAATMALTPWIRRFLIRKGFIAAPPPRSKRAKSSSPPSTPSPPVK